MTKSKLPNKPSALIRVAIGDFRKVLRSKRYVVDMVEWHDPRNDGCHVCLAGSVMAMSLNAGPHEFHTGIRFGTEADSKIAALEDFRSGLFYSGINRMTKRTISKKRLTALDALEGTLGREIDNAMMAAQYENASWRKFIRLMLKAADELEAIKL